MRRNENLFGKATNSNGSSQNESVLLPVWGITNELSLLPSEPINSKTVTTICPTTNYLWQRAITNLRFQQTVRQQSFENPLDQTMRVFDLLTKQEERELFETLRAGENEILLSEEKQTNPDELALEKIAAAIQARQMIFLSNIRLVTSIAGTYKNKNPSLELDSLQSAGWVGLSRAIDKFDLSKRKAFSTYATPWIDSRCREYAATRYFPFEISPETVSKFKRTMEKVEEYGYAFFETQYNSKKYMTLREFSKFMQLRFVLSIQQPLHNDSSPEQPLFLGDAISDGTDTFFNQLPPMFPEEVEQMFDKLLTPREAYILKLRFGFADKLSDSDPSFRQIGDVYKVGGERIRQIYEEAMEKLRRYFEENNITFRDLFYVSPYES